MHRQSLLPFCSHNIPKQGETRRRTAHHRITWNRRLQNWIRRLIDLSRRNNLLYYRDLKTERVQGDERDAIILTLGTGKDRAGRLHRQVRPLNQKGGERRLNFASGRIARLDDIARLAVFFASE